MKLKDIARVANVSISTVSLVLNNKEGVSKEKRDLIQNLLVENGYTVPESKVLHSTRNIRFLKYSRHGMLVNGNPGFVNSILDSVEKECRFQNCNLVMTAFDYKQKSKIIDIVKQDLYDGIILLGTEFEYEDLKELFSIPVPIVLVDCPARHTDISSVTMDNQDAIHSLVSHLVELGHTRIGFLRNSLPSENCSVREDAYRHSLEEFNLPRDESLIYELMPTMTGSYNSMKRLLDMNTKFPSALVANNDAIALGAMRALREYGISIPQDISISGFDDISFAAISEPPLTTVAVPCSEIGIWAVRLIINYINYPKAASAKIKITPRLQVRGSTGPYQPSNNPFRL